MMHGISSYSNNCIYLQMDEKCWKNRTKVGAKMLMQLYLWMDVNWMLGWWKIRLTLCCVLHWVPFCLFLFNFFAFVHLLWNISFVESLKAFEWELSAHLWIVWLLSVILLQNLVDTYPAYNLNIMKVSQVISTKSSISSKIFAA